MVLSKNLLLGLLGSLLVAGCGGGGDETSGDGDGDDVNASGGQATGDGDTNGSGGARTAGGCDNCTNGCCDGDTCIPFAIQTATQCGDQGFECAACDFGQQCGGSGLCETDTEICSQYSCDGCCLDEATCVPPVETYWDACGASGETCNVCDFGAECAVDGACTSAIDESAYFYVTIESVKLEQTNQGASWDVLDSADPMVCVTDGVDEECTPSCTDVLECDFGADGELSLAISGADLAAGYLEFSVYDYDGASANDLAGSVGVIQTELLSSGSSYSESKFGGVAKLTYSLRPAF